MINQQLIKIVTNQVIRLTLINKSTNKTWKLLLNKQKDYKNHKNQANKVVIKIARKIN